MAVNRTNCVVMITIQVIAVAIEVDKFTMLVIKRDIPGIESTICDASATASVVIFIYFCDSFFPTFL